MHAPRPLNEREVCLAGLCTAGQGEFPRIQMFSGFPRGEMRGAGRVETAQRRSAGLCCLRKRQAAQSLDTAFYIRRGGIAVLSRLTAGLHGLDRPRFKTVFRIAFQPVFQQGAQQSRRDHGFSRIGVRAGDDAAARSGPGRGHERAPMFSAARRPRAASMA